MSQCHGDDGCVPASSYAHVLVMNKRLRYSLGVVLVVILVCVAYYMRVPLPADVKVHETLHDRFTLTVTATKTIIAWRGQSRLRIQSGAFVMLTRNSDLEGAMDAIRSIEDRFNTRHGYPYVFLNDEEFSDEFKTRGSLLESITSYGRMECVSSLALWGTSSRWRRWRLDLWRAFPPSHWAGSRWGFFGFFFSGGVGFSALRLFGCCLVLGGASPHLHRRGDATQLFRCVLRFLVRELLFLGREEVCDWICLRVVSRELNEVRRPLTRRQLYARRVHMYQ
ncbi:hypothetical protein BDZ89DRAFT_1068238 [Hymenopellis radicata]|nr:hypothetical protein BDZ89DRAFT_1068238 [Hymenopellis radicata]